MSGSVLALANFNHSPLEISIEACHRASRYSSRSITCTVHTHESDGLECPRSDGVVPPDPVVWN